MLTANKFASVGIFSMKIGDEKFKLSVGFVSPFLMESK